MQWTYKGEEFTSEMIGDNIGFVYIITNLENNKKYIGQKLFKNKAFKTVKKKRKRITVESNWKDYFGSSLQLQEDVANSNISNFKREILYLCKTKGMMNYLELEEQVLRKVLFDDSYYNAFIGGKIHKRHVVK